MGALEPLINILTVLTVLSVAAERATNIVKLRQHRNWQSEQDRSREFRITSTNLTVGVVLAIAMKADLFAMLAQPSQPWLALGWTHWNGSAWVRDPAVSSVSGLVQALMGSAVTGISLGFGARFWHDVLGAVFEMRKLASSRRIVAEALAAKPDAETRSENG